MIQLKDIKALYGDNPFVDILLYCCKIIAFGSVVKLESEATKYETLESIKESDLYLTSIEDSGMFELYTYDEKFLNMSSIPKNKVTFYANHNDKIPTKYRDELYKIARDFTISHYDEKNEYYRKVCGMQKYDDYGIPLKPYLYLLPSGVNFGSAVYVHEIGAEGARLLEKYGAMDAIKADYPDAEYLDYMHCGITIQKARRYVDKQIIYQQSCGIPEIDEIFWQKYELNREFVDKRVDSKAMEFMSENYQQFLVCYILFLTICDVINTTQERIIRKDVLDARCIKYIFEMYGVPYYKNIPIKYQITLCKNINRLCQYKSSPQEMFNIIQYFEAEDQVEINKYFLLRNRKMDKWGNILYTRQENYYMAKNTIVVHKSVDKKIPKDDSEITIPYPFDYFLQKGNVMFIWADGYKLIEGVDYRIYNYDKLEFLNDKWKKCRTLTYDFYYDKTTINSELTPLTGYSINIYTEQIHNDNNASTFTLNPPYADYFKDGNDALVSVGSTFLNPAFYSTNTNNELTLHSSVYTKERMITVVYIYAPNIIISKFAVGTEIATVDKQKTFNVPEPFNYYVANNNAFFISIGTTYIDSRRYTIDRKTHTITLENRLADDQIITGRHVVFYFIYAAQSVPNPLILKKTTETITATQNFQYEFDLNYPINDYIRLGFKPFVKLRGWYLDNTYFTLFANKMVLNDKSISLQPGETMDMTYYYVDLTDDSHVYQDYIDVDSYTNTFHVNYPLDNYFYRGNKLIVDLNGYILEEGKDYKYINDYNELVIINYNFAPKKGEKINLLYIYNTEYIYSIRVKQETNMARKDLQTDFYLDYPFYPYLQTGHSYLLMKNSILIDKDRNVTTPTKFITRIENGDFFDGQMLNILYIYNKKFELDKEQLLIVKEVTLPKASMQDPVIYPVKEPFLDYIINDWPWFVDTERHRQKENRDYDVLNGEIVYIDPKKTIDKYNSTTETFVYKNVPPWIYQKSDDDGEDVDKDFDLVFMKIPLDNILDNDKIIKKNMNLKKYDPMTLADNFWDGDDNADNAHEAVKHQIKKVEFNYLRTKYMGVDYLADLSEMGFEIPYFYNMLFDDVLKEEQVTVKIPTIAPYINFKLGHVFCYMISLAYFYRGMDDTIMQTPTQIMYCRGFNFNVNLEKIKEWILDIRYKPEDFDVFNFAFGYNNDPSSTDKFSHTLVDMKSPKELVDVFRNNKEIYNVIVKGMIDADDYDIYKIWKDLYDSMMRWKFNLDYFKLSDGSVAKTFTEFLKEKDSVLYTSLINIENISDDDTRNEEILQMFDDIIYVLDEYIDSKEFRYLYYNFPGAGEYLAEYVFMMINFFKSYKVVFTQITTNLDMSGQGNENTIKIYDYTNKLITLEKPDYIAVRDSPDWLCDLPKPEKIHLREKIWLNIIQPRILNKDTDAWKFMIANKITKEIFGNRFNPALIKQSIIDGKFKSAALKQVDFDNKFNSMGLNINDLDNKFDLAKLIQLDITNKFKSMGLKRSNISGEFSILALINKDGFNIDNNKFNTILVGIGYPYYIMSSLYPNTYKTMTEIPKELLRPDGSVNLITDSLYNEFNQCKGLKSIPKINNTSKCINMCCSFYDCNSLTTLDVSNWDTSKVTDMSGTFCRCYSLTSLDASNWDTGNVTNMDAMFSYCYSFTSLDVSNWDTSNVTNMRDMFNTCNKLTTLDVSKWDTSKVTNMYGMFNYCNSLTSLNVSNFDTSNVTNIKRMFFSCSSLTTLDVSNWDTSNVTNMCIMFSYCQSLTTLDVSNWDTGNVTDMSGMFINCKSLTTLDVSKWNTSNVVNMKSMFYGCNSLTSLDVSNWDTSNVTNMNRMFNGCTALITLDVSNWDTGKVTNMKSMFFALVSLTSLDVSKWNTSNTTDMSMMFFASTSLTSLDISNWDTSKVTNMDAMFGNCNSLTTITGEIDMSSCTNYKDMFNGCNNLTNVTLKNVPANFNPTTAGLSAGQYTII